MTNLKSCGKARKIHIDELERWYSCPKESSDKDFEYWVNDEKQWVSQFSIPIRNLFVFEQEGKFTGKLCFIEEHSSNIVFAMPAIKISPDCKHTALKLFELALNETRSRKVPRLETYLDDCNSPYEILKEALLDTGFLERKQKVIYSRDLEKPIEHNIEENLTFKNAAGMGYDKVKELYIESLKGSLDYSSDLYPQSPDEEFKQYWNSVRNKEELLKIAYHNEQLIGLLFADDIHENTVTFWYIAVLPEFRGRGYGNLLFAYGLNFLHLLGAKHHIGSTAVINQPMVKVFESNGCKKIMSRIEFIYLNP